MTGEDRRRCALGHMSEAMVATCRARDLLTDAGDQAEGEEMTEVLRILGVARATLRARNRDAVRDEGKG